MKYRHSTPEISWLSSVAQPAPATPIFSVRINTMSSATFSRLHIIRNTSGVLESPSDRRMPDRRLYSMVAGMPRKITKI